MRYPEGMFSVQAQVYGTYHMTDPQIFYNKEDLWKVAQRDGGSGREGATVSPYFTVTKLAGVGAQEEFILMLPFTPSRKENMIAWMSARCDPPHYGKLLVYSFPKQRLVYGPQQIESRINQDTEISRDLTLWNQQGSQVIRGNLLVVPVDSSLVYFQPLYLQSAGQAGLPELKRILVAFGDRIAMEPTMAAALGRIFGGGASDHLESVAAAQRSDPAAAAGASGLARAPARRPMNAAPRAPRRIGRDPRSRHRRCSASHPGRRLRRACLPRCCSSRDVTGCVVHARERIPGDRASWGDFVAAGDAVAVGATGRRGHPRPRVRRRQGIRAQRPLGEISATRIGLA
jgi:uncharacterized membrane protein (UPF0182 family)